MSFQPKTDTRAFDNAALRRAAQAARARKNKHKHHPGPGGHARAQPEEHYHLIYHVPAQGLAIPYFKETYGTVREGYLKVAWLGHMAEPNTEWYENGEVGFETRIPGRLGLYWVVVEVTGCIRRNCAPVQTVEEKKRRLFRVVPNDGEGIPLETET